MTDFLVALAQERVAEVYKPDSVKPEISHAETVQTLVKQPSNFKWRYDVMLPLRPARPGMTSRDILQEGVDAKVELSKGERAKEGLDAEIDERTLLLFWTTFYITPYGEVWHEHNGAWRSMGQT